MDWWPGSTGLVVSGQGTRKKMIGYNGRVTNVTPSTVRKPLRTQYDKPRNTSLPMRNERASTLGRYQILAELGRGAMGVVYKAYDPKINRYVAIKTISLVAAAESDQALRARIFQEAEAAGRLSHPRIVCVFDIGEEASTSNPYIVMEYVAGRSLEDILSTKTTDLPLETTLQWIQEVAEALDYAHQHGVVHRDVKPSNILIGEDGHAKIADFGISQLNFGDTNRLGRTWGTPAYMSPEQIKGEPVDGRSDLFSLGVVLYTVLAGHRPFQGNSARTISVRIVNGDPVPVTAFNVDLAPELDEVVTRAITKNPAERYQTGMEMVRALQHLRDEIDSQGEERIDGITRTASVRTTPSNSSPKSTNASATEPHSFPQSRLPTLVPTAVPLSPPWQQAGVAVMALGSLVLAFLGLWWAIPISATPSVRDTTATTAADFRRPTVGSSPELRAPEPRNQAAVEIVTKNIPRAVSAAESHPSAAAARSCQLGIAVEHHFVTADLSLWIDDQERYNHSLRGAVNKRVVLFKGVKGYLSDVVPLAPGNHQIRVRVLSADGSYDESGSISGTFVPGNQKLLAVDFDKHNRRMRLTFTEDNHF